MLAPLFILFTRIQPGEALQHPYRQRIVETLGVEQPLHLRELQRRVGLPWGQFEFHLRRLQRTSHVRIVKREQRSLAMLTSMLIDHLDLPRSPAARVLEVLPEDGTPVPLRELAEKTSMSRQALYYHLTRMVASGAVERVPGEAQAIRRARSSSCASAGKARTDHN